MSLLSTLFPPARPRRRRTAVVGGLSLFGLIGVYVLRTFTGKDVGLPCASTNDCKRALICAEGMEEGRTGKKRGDGVQLCAKPCLANDDCGAGLSCQVAREHTLGPRGGRHESKAKACLAAE